MIKTNNETINPDNILNIILNLLGVKNKDILLEKNYKIYKRSNLYIIALDNKIYDKLSTIHVNYNSMDTTDNKDIINLDLDFISYVLFSIDRFYNISKDKNIELSEYTIIPKKYSLNIGEEYSFIHSECKLDDFLLKYL